MVYVGTADFRYEAMLRRVGAALFLLTAGLAHADPSESPLPVPVPVPSVVGVIQLLNSGVGSTTGDRCEAGLPPPRPLLAENKTITDAVVDSLDCGRLTKANVLSFVSAEKLTEKNKRLGYFLRNFSTPGMSGQCWALTRAQRKLLYLTTTDPKPAAKTAEEALRELDELGDKREAFFNMIRGTVPEPSCLGRSPADRPEHCELANAHEPRAKLQMVTLASDDEIGNFIDVLRSPLKITRQTPLAMGFESAWYARNKDLFPDLKKYVEEETVKQSKVSAALEKLRIDSLSASKAINDRFKRGEIDRKARRELLQEVEAKEEREDDRIHAEIFGGQMIGKAIEQIPGERFLQQDLVAAQSRLVVRAGNLRFLGGRARGIDDDKTTSKELHEQLQAGRLPLLNIRFALTAQHIVLVKSVQTMPNGEIHYTVYDSNIGLGVTKSQATLNDGTAVQLSNVSLGPPKDQTLIFKNGRFYYNPPYVPPEMTDPVGVFITDDDDMDEIRDAMFEYYRGKCGLR